MSRKEIEKKDQELIKKVREIVHSKEKKMPARRAYIFWIALICSGMIAAGLMILKKQPTTLMSNDPKHTSGTLAENNQTSVPKKPAHPDSSTGAQSIVPAENEDKKQAAPVTMKTNELKKKGMAEKTAPKPSETISSKNPGNKKTVSRATLKKKTPQGIKPPTIQIAEMVSCTSVKDRQYASPQKTFSIKEGSTPVVWMKVLSDNPPFTLTHVYYVNERRYCEVPLTIRYTHMRTWSSITLSHQNQAGEWRVEVVTGNGRKLDQIKFTVVE